MSVMSSQLRGTYLQYGRKMSWFDCVRYFLPRNRALRRNKNAFTKGTTVHGQPPQRLTPEMEWQKVHDLPKVTEEPEI